MLRVLIVDDEKIVRKGLILTIPWKRYGMEIASDAGSAEEALSYLASDDKVDLMLVDIEMPNMNGIELARIVKTMYPSISIVILTFHQKFEYIKAAMRLDTLDYITKSELNSENVDELFTNLAREITEEKARRIQSLNILSVNSSPNDSVYFYFKPKRDGQGEVLYDIDYNEVRLSMVMEDIQSKNNTICLKVNGVRNISIVSVSAAFEKYFYCDFFYQYKDGCVSFTADYTELLREGRIFLQEDFSKLLDRLSGFSWIISDSEFSSLHADFLRLKLPPEQFVLLIKRAFLAWQRFLPQGFDMLSEEKRYFFYQWMDWLVRIRTLLAEQTQEGGLPFDIRMTLKKAVEYIQANFYDDITLDKMAKYTNLSKSYFCSCFKEYTGKTLIEFLNITRIQNACNLIKTTSSPLYWIASNTGFSNEKYFSKVFKSVMGCLPKDYK